MLTKSDVKVIGNLFEEKFDKKFDEKFDKKFDARLDRVFDKKFDEKLKPVHDDIKIIKNDVKKLRKDVDTVINMSDKGLLKVQTRVKTIEKHLGLPEADFV
jgi:hypothetical protein